MLNFFYLAFDLRYPKNISSDFANIFVEESLKILEWANNNVQRDIKLSTLMDE